MKKKHIILTVLGMVIYFMGFSQMPKTFAYQTILRYENGNLVKSKSVSLDIILLKGSEDGEVVYEEIHNARTDENGIVSIEIGSAESDYIFDSIDWKFGLYCLKTIVNVEGSVDRIESISRITSVPYVFYAYGAGHTTVNYVEEEHLSLSNVLANGNDAGNMQIKGLAKPTDSCDAVNKAYMDSIFGAAVDTAIAYSMVNPIAESYPAFDIMANNATIYGKARVYSISELSAITDCGVVYGTDSGNLSDTVHCSLEDGSFMVLLSGLTERTTYYYKSYAINQVGSGFGELMSFTTNGVFTDNRDGSVYEYAVLGDQVWMADNLRYAGDIPLGSEINAEIAYRYYPNGDAANVEIYGYLYNWKAAMNGEQGSVFEPSGVQGVCPDGWHLPSYDEWHRLQNYQGLAGHTELWQNIDVEQGVLHNINFCNSGFNALPSGAYSYGYHNFGTDADFWTATDYSSNSGCYSSVSNNGVNANATNYFDYAVAVRCVRDIPANDSVVRLTVETLRSCDIDTIGATLRGRIAYYGGEPLVECGFVYGESEDSMTDTLRCSQLSDIYRYSLSGLNIGTRYYYKAFAVSSSDTAFGDAVQLSTLGVFVDSRDGNRYTTLNSVDGSVTYLAENLRYEGDIQLITESSPEDDHEEIPYRYYPGGNEENVATHGYLYNWYAASTMGVIEYDGEQYSVMQGPCPQGWLITQYLDDYNTVHYAPRLAGNADLWENSQIVNSIYFGTSGYNCMPSGTYQDRSYISFGENSHFWCSPDNEDEYEEPQGRVMSIYGDDYMLRDDRFEKYYGLSVRCMRYNER